MILLSPAQLFPANTPLAYKHLGIVEFDREANMHMSWWNILGEREQLQVTISDKSATEDDDLVFIISCRHARKCAAKC